MKSLLQSKHRGRKLCRWMAVLCLIGILLISLTGCGTNPAAGTAAQNGQQAVAQSVQTEDADLPESMDSPEGVDSPEAEEPAVSAQESPAKSLPEDGSYTTKEDVALYLHTYGTLPSNFMTKKEAQKLGWQGGSLEDYAPGKSIGGDRFGNYEGILPDGSYHECDIDTSGASGRGAKRIVYSDDGRIYYTEDHYETFVQLY